MWKPIFSFWLDLAWGYSACKNGSRTCCLLYKNEVTGSTADNYTGMLVGSWKGSMVCSCMYTFAKGNCWIGIGSRRYMCVDGWTLDGSLKGWSD